MDSTVIVDHLIMKELESLFGMKQTPYFLISDANIWGNILYFRIDNQILFCWVSYHNGELLWCIKNHDYDSPVFSKISRDDFSITTDLLLSKLSIEDAKSFIFELNTIQDIFREKDLEVRGMFNP